MPNNPGWIPFRSFTHNRVVPVVARSAEMCGLRVRYALFNYFLVNGHLWLRILDHPSSVCLEEAFAQVPEPPSYKVMTRTSVNPAYRSIIQTDSVRCIQRLKKKWEQWEPRPLISCVPLSFPLSHKTASSSQARPRQSVRRADRLSAAHRFGEEV